jgi:hypothetical protein
MEVLDDRRINGATEIGVLVGDGAGAVANSIVDVLKAALAHELVTRAERNLDHAPQFSKFARSVCLDVRDALVRGCCSAPMRQMV